MQTIDDGKNREGNGMIFTLTRNARVWVLHAPISPSTSILEVQFAICFFVRDRVGSRDSFFIEPDFATPTTNISFSHFDLWRQIASWLPRTPRVVGVRDTEIGCTLIRREGLMVFSEPRVEELRDDHPLFTVAILDLSHGAPGRPDDAPLRGAPTLSLY